MIESIPTGIDDALAFRVSGKITKQEMTAVLAEAREKIAAHGSIVLLEEIDSFEGVEWGALVEEFRYLFEIGISNIRKAAVVTDKKWIGRIVAIEDKVFRGIEMKCFPKKDRDAAIAFLQEPVAKPKV